MINLISLELWNFFSFEHATIDLSKPGLYLIIGYDQQIDGSNGSGKSTILSAISWALFGKTLKGVQGSDVVRWDKKECKVILKLSRGGDTYEIERTLSSLSFQTNSIPSKGGRIDIQSTINTTLKTDWYSFSRTTAFSQGQVEFLAASGDSDKKRLFKDLLGLSRLYRVYEKVRLRYDHTFSATERCEQDIGYIERTILNLESKFQEAELLNTDWERIKTEKIVAMNNRKPPLPKNLSLISTEIKNIQKTLDAFSIPSIDDLNKVSWESSDQIERNESEIQRLWEVIQKGQEIDTRCELCGSMVNKKMFKFHRRELEDKIEELKNNNEELSEKRRSINSQLDDIGKMNLEKLTVQKQLEDKKYEFLTTDLKWEDYKRISSEIEIAIQEVTNDNPYSNICNSLNSELVTQRNSLLSKGKEFETLKVDIDILAFLKWTFSREGVASFIIEKSFERLQYLTNQFLSSISKGLIQITITPQKELKSGELKEQIDIQVDINGQKTTYWGLSDGQRQRLNVAMLLALHKLCREYGINAFNFLLLDEILDISLDKGGQEDVITLLTAYLRECKNIILISHKDELKESFDWTISVIRDEKGISTIV